ncbi:MAG: hypothetical protein O2930_06900 [Acidobacteria bacterium]|nr:hypothetical protein [Acidobacteriota bacterium]
MMHIRRAVTLAVVGTALLSASALAAQQADEQQQQRDTQALVELVEAVAAGTEPTPADVSLQWGGNHFMKGADGATYIPFTLGVDPAQLTGGAALYIRAVNRDAAPAADPAAAVEYPWDDINFLDVGQDGTVARAMVLPPGEYEVFVAIKEQGQAEAGAGLLRRDITVPDFSELSMSTVLIGNIEPLAAPLNADQQKENPYTFGQMRVTVAAGSKLRKAGELQMLFWIYGTGQRNNKPDVTIEYSFHRQTADGEEYFNKTPPQTLNASTLPPQFNVATDQLPGMLFVPLASFPVGEYRLEIKLTDTISGETLTTDANFTVEA